MKGIEQKSWRIPHANFAAYWEFFAAFCADIIFHVYQSCEIKLFLDEDMHIPRRLETKLPNARKWMLQNDASQPIVGSGLTFEVENASPS